ncbi:MAG: hypothetical protein Q7U04_06150 [Bacteriovorax sp.]|nr:hypothetical protein [Bacteriovorax sp.]
MIKLKLFILIAAMFSQNLSATETDDAVAKLTSQLTLITKIKRFVDTQDQGRLIVLKNSTEQTITAIKTNGLTHTKTLNQYLNQFVTYKTSTSYFSYINTAVIAPDVKSLYDIMDAITKERGLDDFTFNKMTYNTFSQMHLLLQELAKGNISDELKSALANITVDFGHLLATANSGDNIPTFKAGAEMFHKIEALYPLLYQAASRGPVFDLILNVQGLNELYGEYAGI